MYIRSYSINYSTTLIIIIVIIIHTIQYIYTTTIDIPNMIFVYIILCHVKRLCYTPTLVYTTLCHTICIYMPYPLWYMTMDYNLIHYINILYYYYYNNYNSYLFFIFIIVLLYVCACMRVCCAVLSLLCVCVLSCVSSHMLIHVYLCVFTPPHPPGLCCGEEANVLI